MSPPSARLFEIERLVLEDRYTAEKRGKLIRNLEDALMLAEELQVSTPVSGIKPEQIY